MLMASARIEVDANCKPGDPLTPVLRKHAARWGVGKRTDSLACFSLQSIATWVICCSLYLVLKGTVVGARAYC